MCNRGFGGCSNILLEMFGGVGQNGSSTKGNPDLGVYVDVFQPSALTVLPEFCSR